MVSDYIKLRMIAAKVNAETTRRPQPAYRDDAFRPRSLSRSRWYEDIVRETAK
jgi:hypothetical protein